MEHGGKGETIRSMYRRVEEDVFPSTMEISFVDTSGRQTLVYEKVTWEVAGERKGLRYGENPGQSAAMYRLVNGNLTLGEVSCIMPGRYAASAVELLQAGKHPGKINVTDADAALGILKHLGDRPTCVIVKHNNPSGVACADTLSAAYHAAFMADPVAAFGGVVAVNRTLDRETAEAIAERYVEVVVAPEFGDGVMEILAGKKNLRVFRIGSLRSLEQFQRARYVDFTSLMDGGVIAQLSYVTETTQPEHFLTPRVEREGRVFTVDREPSAAEAQDLLLAWHVCTAVTSNSVLYVKGGVTMGIGTGEQDRVGCARFARDKAYRNAAERIALREHGSALRYLEVPQQRQIEERVAAAKAGLPGAVMASDAFFPFRDGVDVGIREGISAVIQPGGSVRDYEVIEACNEAGVAMVFTGQRAFRH
ncbi:MAG: IMP cyclohydrolase [Spirochaetaceae bacterium]